MSIQIADNWQDDPAIQGMGIHALGDLYVVAFTFDVQPVVVANALRMIANHDQQKVEDLLSVLCQSSMVNPT